ncbi:MAG TPA: hypothetical protein VN222_09850 [Novosphingobium sp.]|nr:hypothetical protein [Novosphingobium sp.]
MPDFPFPIPSPAPVVALWCDWALLCSEAMQVIGLRLWLIAQADRRAAAESERMVSEKVEALAQVAMRLAMAQWAAQWDGRWIAPPERQAARAVTLYRGKVRANLKRLSR